MISDRSKSENRSTEAAVLRSTFSEGFAEDKVLQTSMNRDRWAVGDSTPDSAAPAKSIHPNRIGRGMTTAGGSSGVGIALGWMAFREWLCAILAKNGLETEPAGRV
jgi:hypothetical protein